MNAQDLGKLLLRLTVGGLMIPHGVHKIKAGFNEGVNWVGPMLADKGLPEFLKYGLYVGELLAPALLIVGFFTRIAALTVAGTMGVAIWLSHSHELTSVTEHGGWAIELPAFFLLASLCIVMLGAGSMAIDGKKSAPAP